MEKEYLIKKWLSNDLTQSEKEAFELLEDNDLHNEIIDGLQYFRASHFSKATDFESLEDRMTSQKPVRRLNWMKPVMRIAGLFIIGLIGYYFFFFNNLTLVNTQASEKITIELPDSSSATLNSLSEISFYEKDWDQNREVTLKGEAFFHVAKGQVFDVISDGGIVTVLGTQFNVKHRGDYFEVICYEGIVEVHSGEFTKKLLKGDFIQIYKGELLTSRTLVDQPQWIDDVSVFQSVPYNEVINELGRQYNIKLEFNSIDTTDKFTGRFVHNNLEDALKSITEPLKLSYKIESTNHVILYNAKK